MDLIGDERGRLARVASWLDASPAEALGLVVLLTGACVASALFVWTALGRPSLPDPAGSDLAAHTDAQGTTAQGTHVGAASAADAGTAPDGPSAADGQVGRTPPVTTDTTRGAGSGPVGEVTVHVAGAVHRPGVVTLPAGARVADAVTAAGGLAPGADLARTNLARPLTDGEQVLVLREGEAAPPGSVASTSGSAGPDDDATQSGPLDLNTATADQLQTLPGIGPTLTGPR